MGWIGGLLILAALLGAYSAGFHRAKHGLGLWPFTVGKDGIHRQPLVLLALCVAASLVACTSKYAPRTPADTTAVAPDSDGHDGDADHDQGKAKGHGKHHGHEGATGP